jgi:hypothetical protein
MGAPAPRWGFYELQRNYRHPEFKGHRFAFKRAPKEVFATLFPGAAEEAEIFSYFEVHT